MTSSKSVLVTGASGFIGHALVKELLQHGHIVHTVDKHPFRLSGVIHHQLSLSQFSFSPLVSRNTTLDCLYHLAWHGSPANPRSDEEVISLNVEPTINFIRQAKKVGVKHFVFMSSAGSVYGETSNPAKENDVLSPQSAYGRGKCAVEEFMEQVASSAMKMTVFRATNVIGKSQTFKNNQGIIPLLIHAAKSGQPLTLYGNSQKDYIDISDLVSALLSITKQPQPYRIYNVGSGQTITLHELAHLVEQTYKVKLNVDKKPASHFDPQHVRVDTSRILKELAWKPQIDIFQTMATLVQQSV